MRRLLPEHPRSHETMESQHQRTQSHSLGGYLWHPCGGEEFSHRLEEENDE